VGQKGVRVQSIISELFGEKIDIVPYSDNLEKFIASSLSPAKVTEVELNYKEKRAIVTVPEDQQSLAIGKEGQNARLANKLTKWKIDIKGVSGVFSSEDAEEGVVKQASDEKVVGVWDAEIKKFNELEEKREKEKKSEKSEKEETLENSESESAGEDSENEKEEITGGEEDSPVLG